MPLPPGGRFGAGRARLVFSRQKAQEERGQAGSSAASGLGRAGLGAANWRALARPRSFPAQTGPGQIQKKEAYGQLVRLG